MTSKSRMGVALLLGTVPVLVGCPSDSASSASGPSSGTTSGSPPECQTDADCPDGLCDNGNCVECLSDADCANPKPICVGEICQGCSLPDQCPETAPICVEDSCLPCSDDAECQELGFDVCMEPPARNAGSCGGCSTDADCPPQYPDCVAAQCTIACHTDPYEGLEPLVLGNHQTGGVIEGFVCLADPRDSFMLPLSGASFVALELWADPKPGNVDLQLRDSGDVLVAESLGHSGLEVIHVRVPAGDSYEVRVLLTSGPAGAPFKLTYRTLPE